MLRVMARAVVTFETTLMLSATENIASVWTWSLYTNHNVCIELCICTRCFAFMCSLDSCTCLRPAPGARAQPVRCACVHVMKVCWD